MATVATYDTVICGAGSSGGFLAGEVAPYVSVLILDAGPDLSETPNTGFGTPRRSAFSTQMNLGTYWADGSTSSPHIEAFYAYPKYDPDFILKRVISQFVTASGVLHPQGTCRARASAKNSVAGH